MADTFDVVVAGGGISGLTAGWWSARLGRRTLVLTGGPPGGLLLSIETVEGVPGFPEGIAGYELCPAAQEQAAASGAEFALAELEALTPQDEGWLLSTSDGDCLSRAVVLATGSRLKELGIAGEDTFMGRGVSHCASCDAPLLRDRIVAVVGGGDSALQEALTLAESVSEVTILHRGDELTAQATYRHRVREHPRITVRYRTVVEEILGDETVKGLRISDLAAGESTDLETAAVFVYVGLRPNTDFLDHLLRVGPDGHVPTDERLRTELTGVLAAGIVRMGSDGQAATSAADGVTAAISADRYLSQGAWPARPEAHAAVLAWEGEPG